MISNAPLKLLILDWEWTIQGEAKGERKKYCAQKMNEKNQTFRKKNRIVKKNRIEFPPLGATTTAGVSSLERCLLDLVLLPSDSPVS